MTACCFKDFTREWGVLMLHDGAPSLDHLLDAYQHADTADTRTATIEDYTDLWTAAKRANLEWEATCMVRSVRQSLALDGAVTPFHLMTSMMCWAATRHQRAVDFFKTCGVQVRDVVANVVARSTAWVGEGSGGDGDDTAMLYEHVAFCVALELFGWHDSLLSCLQAVAAQRAGLVDEQGVFLYIATVVQFLTPRHPPRGFSAESTPNITTSRTSALSSSSEHDAACGRDDAAVVSDYLPSPPQHQQQQQQQQQQEQRQQRCAVSEDAASLHVRFDQTRAVGRGRVEAPPSPLSSCSPSSPCSPQLPPPPPPPRAPPTCASPSSPTMGRSMVPPQQPPRSRGTPQPSPKNASPPATVPAPAAAPAAAERATPPVRRDSETTSTSTSREKTRKAEIKEKRWPLAPKKGRRGSKKDAQGCVAF